jgi:hypothetical protein
LKYFYDCEFIEDGKTIDLISIGMVRADGRALYAISTEFDISKANIWVKENVLIHLPPRNVNPSSVSPRELEESRAWRSRDAIRQSLMMLVGNDPAVEFWGYYSAYDHVALCQLFGTMMDLPRNWPYYTRDLRQWADSMGIVEPLDKFVPATTEHHALADAEWNRRAYQFLLEREFYPPK